MTMPRLSPPTLRDARVRAAATVLAAAVAVLVAGIVGALRVAPVDAAPPAPAVPDSALRFAPAGAGTDIAAAVARDLFAPDRTPPPRRYRLPGEGEVLSSEPAPRPVVLGTAIAASGEHFATCQVAGGPPAIVRVGSRIGEHVVVAIARGAVTFRSPDGERFTIQSLTPRP